MTESQGQSQELNIEGQPLLFGPADVQAHVVGHTVHSEDAIPSPQVTSNKYSVAGIKHGVSECCSLPSDVLIMVTAVCLGLLGLLFELDLLLVIGIILVSFNVCGCARTSIVTSIPSIFVFGILLLALAWRDLPRIFRIYILHSNEHAHNTTKTA